MVIVNGKIGTYHKAWRGAVAASREISKLWQIWDWGTHPKPCPVDRLHLLEHMPCARRLNRFTTGNIPKFRTRPFCYSYPEDSIAVFIWWLRSIVINIISAHQPKPRIASACVLNDPKNI